MLWFLSEREVDRTYRVRYDSYLLVDELRQSSDELTRCARSYVSTGDSKFERIYWEILAIRNGEIPRPRNYERIYWDRVLGEPDSVGLNSDDARVSLRALMERAGFTSAEFDKLEEAELNSNQLVKTERVAFNAMKGLFQDSMGQFTVKRTPDSEFARNILFDRNYHEAKAAIMKPLNEVYELVDARTSGAVAAAEYRAYICIGLVFFLLAVVLICLGFSFAIVRRKVASLIRLEKGTRQIGAGIFTSPFDINSRDEIARLSHAFVALDQKVAERTRALEMEVTANSNAAVALRKSEESYRELFENANDAIYVHDLEGTYLSANRAAEKLIGCSRDEIIGKNIAEFIAPEYVERMHANLSKKLEAKESTTYEIELCTEDGRRVAVEVSSRLIYETGAPVGVQSMARDMTERKRAEMERQVIAEIVQTVITAANLDDLFKLAHEAINKILPAENCFIALHNLATDLIQYEYWVDKVDTAPSPHPPDKGLCSHILRSSQPLLLGESFESRKHKGDEVELSGTDSPSWLGVPLRTSSRIIGVLVVQHYEKESAYSQRDVEFLTSVGDQLGLAIERKRIEIELRTNEMQLTGAQQIAHIGNWEWDVVKKNLHWSKELFRIFGLKPRDFGPSVAEFFAQVYPEDVKLVERAIKKALRYGVVPSFNFRIVRAPISLCACSKWMARLLPVTTAA